jgi:hypothetical protein
MDFRKKLLVDSHVKFKISNFDQAYKGTHESHLNDLVRRLGANRQRHNDFIPSFREDPVSVHDVHQPTRPLILRVLRAI